MVAKVIELFGLESNRSDFHYDLILVTFGLVLLIISIVSFQLVRRCFRHRSNVKNNCKFESQKPKINLDSFDFMLNQLRDYQIPKQSLSFIRDIGQGEFGRVVQAKLLHRTLIRNNRNSANVKVDVEANHDEVDSENDYKIVAVKMLKSNNNRISMEQSMLREAYIMGMLNNENLLGLIAVCDPGTNQMCMLVDYMAKGDLNSFLRFRSQYTNPETRPADQDDASLQTMLLNFALQIVNGMEYLSSFGLVHRDLATRNCLIDENLVVKISDFGMAQLETSTDKSNETRGRSLQKNLKKVTNSFILDSDEQQTLLQNEKLPIRWMSLEAVLFQTFTSASDVWAFGVLLWELFTFAAFPYTDIPTNKQVIQHLVAGKRMAAPDLCPTTVALLMMDCWHLDPIRRPSFTLLKQQLEQAQQDVNRQKKRRYFFFC